MRIRRSLRIAALAAALTAMALSPAHADVSSNIGMVAKIDFPQGTHLEFMVRPDLPDANGDPRVFALAGSRDVGAGGLRIIEITDPDNPVLLKVVGCKAADAMDVAVVNVGAKWYAALGSNSNAPCSGTLGNSRTVSIVDVTDPANAVYMGWPAGKPYPTKGAHTLVKHPTLPLVYVSSQSGPERITTVEMLDFAPFVPGATPPTYRQVQTILTGTTQQVSTTFSPHDLTFSPDGTRAFASNVTNTTIMDTSDALNPRILSVIAAPATKIHHEAVLHPNGRHLLLVDEFFALGQTSGNPQCPGGGVSVFDLGPARAWELAPVQVGYMSAVDTSTIVPSNPTILDPACTAHEFSVSSDGSWMPIGWMGAGVRTFDLSAINAATTSPVPVPIVAPETGYYKEAPLTDAWAAKTISQFPGYIFVNDTARGFRVMKRVP